jgi:primosomal protein N' (replication factor Y)
VRTWARLARVLPDITGLDKQFDYCVPDDLDVQVGTVVRVPLGPRRVRGWVLDVGEWEAPEGIRSIAAVAGVGPPATVVDLARWAAWRWVGPLRPLLVTASGPRLVRRPAIPTRRRRTPDPAPVRRSGVVRLAPCADALDLVLAAAACGSVLVVCPSVDGAALLGARLRGAGLSVAGFPDEWARAAGGVDVVIGPRSTVWAPCPDLGAVVVLDEHDEVLQEERSPTWHARDVAIERAARAAVPCWLVSPCPSLEALAWAGAAVSRPSRVDERAGWPIVEVVDRTREDPLASSWLTPRLAQLARDPRQRLVVVVNIRGRARRLRCRACGAPTVCERCAAGVAQARGGELSCDRCHTQRPPVCQSCGSTRLVGLGRGAARIRDELAAAVGRPVVEISSDTKPDVVPPDAVFVGTEAVLHHVHDATTVAFVDFDDELLAPRFRAGEEAMALVVRAARLVGARAGGGRVLLQTRMPHHEVVQAAVHADPQRLVAAERARREELHLPPVSALAAVSGAAAGTWLAGAPASLAVSGPVSGRWLVRAADHDELAAALWALGPRPRGVRVEVDPHRV